MAHKYMRDHPEAPDASRIADLNPHRADPARGRWSEGFNKAITSMYAK